MKHFSSSPTLTPIKLASSFLILMSIAMSLAVSAKTARPIPVQGNKGAAKEVVNKLVAENFEGIRADFNEEMRRVLSAEQMKQVWTAAIQYHGKFKSQGEPNNSQQQGHDVYSIRCEMERSPMEVIVAYDQNGKIGGLWFRPAAS